MIRDKARNEAEPDGVQQLYNINYIQESVMANC